MTEAGRLGAGRFAPSPSGELHIGNIRSGLLACARARQTNRRFLWRIEDLDRVKSGAAESQLEVFAELGVVPDETSLVQSERIDVYEQALANLAEAGLVYECYCTRKDILAAPSAPHAPLGAYPGTCRSLTDAERASARQRLAGAGRTPALRLRASATDFTVTDALLGQITAPIDDFVLRRGDGVFAYNFVVVIDDAASGVDEVVRGDDLASSAPRQAYLASLLGLPPMGWLHVPLVLAPSGARLAKRDGSVTYRQLRARGWSLADVFAWMGESLRMTVVGSPWSCFDDMVAGVDFARLPFEPTIFTPPE